VKRGYVIATVDGLPDMTTWYSYVLLNFFHPWMAAECGEEVEIRLATVCGEWRQCVH